MTAIKANMTKILLYTNVALSEGTGLNRNPDELKSSIFPIKLVTAAPDIKLNMEKNPIPTPICSFDNVREMVLVIQIIINVVPALPKVNNSIMVIGETPTNVDNNT